jgi:hypothetical protein
MKMNLRPLLESLRRTRDKFIDAARMVPNITIGSACLQRKTPGNQATETNHQSALNFVELYKKWHIFSN